MGKTLYVFLLLAISVSTALGADSKLNNSRTPAFEILLDGEKTGIYGHPRIWVTPEKIDRLKTKAVASNQIWVGLRDTNASHFRLGDYKKYADAAVLFNFALGYLATGNKDDLRAARVIFSNFPSKYDISCNGSQYCGNPNLDYGSIDLIYLSAAYDWLSNVLTDEVRLQIRDWVFEKLLPFLRKHPYAADPTHNLGHTKWIGELMWGLATLGDDSRADDVVNKQYLFWRDQVAPLMDKTYPGGHTFSGSGYGYNRSYKWALYGMEALTTATTTNAYAPHSWAVDEIAYRIHSILPSGRLFHSDWESSEATFNEGRQTENEVLLVNRFQGTRWAKYGQFFLKNWLKTNRVHRYYVGPWFLWFDPDFDAESYSAEPTAYVARGLGVGFSRSSWSDKKSAWASFSAASYIADHQLHNEGSFKIWHEGEYLVIENGPCYAANDGDKTPTDANILFLGDGIVNLGALTGGLPRRGEPNTVEISRFSQGESYAYFQGDLSRAYQPTFFPLEYFFRSFVHLKPTGKNRNDYFVVADRIKRTQPVQMKQLIHVSETATILGKDASFVTTSGLNRLQVRSILPATATLQATPVPDKTKKCLAQEASDHPTQLTIHEPAPMAQDVFLTVFYPGNAKSSMPETESIEVIGGGMTGVLIKDAAVNRGFIFATSTSPVTAALSFSIHPTAPTEVLVADLKTKTAYQLNEAKSTGGTLVTLVPSPSGNVITDDQGLARFSLIGGHTTH